MNVLIDCELGDLGLGNDDSTLPSELAELSLYITKCSGDTQSARQHTIWTVEHLLLLTSYLTKLVCDRNCLESLCLIYLSSVILDSVELSFFVRSMIL